jgi:hypothetical protein
MWLLTEISTLFNDAGESTIHWLLTPNCSSALLSSVSMHGGRVELELRLQQQQRLSHAMHYQRASLPAAPRHHQTPPV